MEDASKKSAWSHLGKWRLKRDSKSIAARCELPPCAFRSRNLELMNQRTDAPFLHALPRDVRVMIYKQLIQNVSSKTLYIDYQAPLSPIPAKRQQNRICSLCLCDILVPASNPSSPTESAQGGFVTSRRSHYCPRSARRDSHISAQLKKYFALVSSCRRVYNEAMPIFYHSFTFHFVHLDSAWSFLVNTPRVHYNALRSISLSWIIQTKLYQKSVFYHTSQTTSIAGRLVDDHRAALSEQAAWMDVCQALASLSCLTDLRITFFGQYFRISEKDLLGPLAKITKPEHFEVELPWVLKDAVFPLDGPLPFKIRRNPGSGREYFRSNFPTAGALPHFEEASEF